MHMLGIMLDVRDRIADVEARLLVARKSVAALCRLAGLNQTTWVRWKNGGRAKAESWEKIEAALAELLAPTVAEAA
jgi:hypothetical protein